MYEHWRETCSELIEGSTKWQNTSEFLPCHEWEMFVEPDDGHDGHDVHPPHTSTYPAARRFLFEAFAVLTTGVPKCSGFVSGSSSKV